MREAQHCLCSWAFSTGIDARCCPGPRAEVLHPTSTFFIAFSQLSGPGRGLLSNPFLPTPPCRFGTAMACTYALVGGRVGTGGPGAATPTGHLHTSHPHPNGIFTPHPHPPPPPCLPLHTHTHTSAPTHPYSRTSPWLHANAVSRRFRKPLFLWVKAERRRRRRCGGGEAYGGEKKKEKKEKVEKEKEEEREELFKSGCSV